MGWPYFDPEYENFSSRINPPRVMIDNETDNKFSLVKIASTNRPGTLLELVQVLTDLDLNISKAYISSDGGWLMDVFHVTDQVGNKITDDQLIEFIQQSLGAKRTIPKTGEHSLTEHTVVELTGRDRRGVLSEISAVLTSLKCNVVAAEVWTHNERLACVVYVTDEETNGPIEDAQRLSSIKEQLSNVLTANDDKRGVKMEFSNMRFMHRERRLHQIMLADRDYQPSDNAEKKSAGVADKPSITIENCAEREYSVVNISCKDRPKLLFDIEYYIRHVDGCALEIQYESQCVIKCLEAAIERRVSEGLKLEVCTRDRVGLLSEVTRLLRENGLTVTRADVSTQGDKALNTFYVSDACGGPVDMKAVDAMSRRVGPIQLHVKEDDSKACSSQPQSIFAFKNLIKSQWERVLMSWGT